MFRWGILSTAKIAREEVVPAIHASERGVVAAVASRDGDKAQDFAERFQIPHAFNSYEAMLHSDTIDGVYIGTTTAQHVHWTLEAIAAGKAVLCEKPIALNAADILTITTAAQTAGVFVAEAFMVHYHPQWTQVAKWLRDGEIGELKRVAGAFSYYNDDPGNMRNQVALGGGAVPDIGVYPLVTTRRVTDCEPQSVLATLERDPRFGTDRYASIDMRFPGFDLVYHVSSQMHLHQSMLFAGTAGTISLDTPFNTGRYGHAVARLSSPSGERVIRFSDNHYTLQCDAFVDAVQGRENRCFSLQSSWRNQRAIDAIYASDEAGERIELK